MRRKELGDELKQLVVTECDKADEVDWSEIGGDEPLLGPESRLGLDSLDALQVVVAVKQRYGVSIEGVKRAREALQSIDVLADYILEVNPDA